jgi:hypothetical protein
MRPSSRRQRLRPGNETEAQAQERGCALSLDTHSHRCGVGRDDDGTLPTRVIDYRLPEELQARAHELLDKNGEGDITPDEQREMMEYARLDNMMTLLKAKLKLKLKQEAE